MSRTRRAVLAVCLWAIGVTLSAQQLEMADSELRVGARAQELSFVVSEYEDAGSRIVRSETDYHSLAEVPIDALAAVFLTRDRIAAYLPNLHEYSWSVAPGGDENVVIEIQRIGVRFMGIDATYVIHQRSEVVDLRHENPRRFLLTYEMIDSPDGNLASSGGSFLLEEVRTENGRQTYIRQQNTTEFRDPFVGFPGLLRAFAPVGTRRLFRAMIAEAERYVDQ